MIARGRTLPIGTVAALALSGCTQQRPPQPIAVPQAPAIVAEAERAAPQVRATILPGDPAAAPGSPPPPPAPRRGDIAITLPGAEVRSVATTVQELTGIAIAVDPAVQAQVSLVTPGPVARSELIGLFEAALRAANLGLVQQGGGYVVRPVAAAQAPVSPQGIGFGTEVLTLRFTNAEEIRKVLDGALPGIVTAVDGPGNRITIAGTTGQRNAARALIEQFDVNWLRNMSFALFVPERTDGRLIAPELDKLINAENAPTRGLVRLITMERLNGILAISAQPQYLDQVRQWVEILDREGESAQRRIFVYRVQNGRARDLARTLNRAFGSGGAEDDGFDSGGSDPFATGERRTVTRPGDAANSRPGLSAPAVPAAVPPGQGAGAEAGTEASGGGGSTAKITADEVNNAVVVYATPRDYAMVESALRKLDLPPYQVMIEAAITEVTLTDTLRYGVQWNWLTGDSTFRVTDGANMPAGPSQAGFSYFLAGNSVSAALNALEQRTNVKVVSAPKLITLNNQTAALQVGDQVPISSGNAVSVENPNAPIVNSIEYRDTGVILKVTPRVNAGGLVLLDIAQEVSDVNTSATAASTRLSSPTISTRRISTSVAVQDGQVIALGGLFRDARTIGKNGVPLLSRIPVIGGLFGSHSNGQNRTELIVLMKPHVIRTVDDGHAVTEELRAKLRTLEPFRTEGRIP
ncbi:Secretin XpsD [Sphingomonas sp. S2M10]|nr:type II secretion system secretin GspD [Sphingomonas sp. S2M10]NLS28363.1 Secretin XpsD [Sphingomonas sp. S2M10]